MSKTVDYAIVSILLQSVFLQAKQTQINTSLTAVTYAENNHACTQHILLSSHDVSSRTFLSTIQIKILPETFRLLRTSATTDGTAL